MLSLNTIGASFLAIAASASAATSSCPFNYPSQVNSTESSNGLTFSVISSNPLTDNRALQLRPNPFLPGGYFVGVDNSSAVLLGNLERGGIYSQARNQVNQLFDLGPTGYININTVINDDWRFTVGFANASQWPGVVDTEWYLIGGSSDGTYSLFHDVPEGSANGFLLCNSETDLSNGPWYQLYYHNYTATPYDFPSCESVGIRTTNAARISNGACDISGETGN